MQPLARLCVGSDCSIGRIAISPATASRGHRRWQTMHNRWQAHKGAACGEVAPIIMCLEVAQHCSTSSTPNDSEVSAPRRLRYRSTNGYAWFAISDGTSSRQAPLQHRITSPTDGTQRAQPCGRQKKTEGTRYVSPPDHSYFVRNSLLYLASASAFARARYLSTSTL